MYVTCWLGEDFVLNVPFVRVELRARSFGSPDNAQQDYGVLPLLALDTFILFLPFRSWPSFLSSVKLSAGCGGVAGKHKALDFLQNSHFLVKKWVTASSSGPSGYPEMHGLSSRTHSFSQLSFKLRFGMPANKPHTTSIGVKEIKAYSMRHSPLPRQAPVMLGKQVCSLNRAMVGQDSEGLSPTTG